MAIGWALGCTSPQPPAPPAARSQPLLSAVESPELVWPDGCAPAKEWTRGSEDLAPFFPDRPAVGRLRLGTSFQRDERVALLLPAGATYRLPFTVPAATDLRTAIGRRADGAAVRLRATIVEDGREPVVLDERELAPGGPERWANASFPLDRWTGRKVVLELASSSLAGGCSGWAAWALPRLVPRERANESRPSVVWVSLDTLRADRLGVYGGKRPTSPEIDRFARAGVRFEFAISQSPWTKPSHRSMLTGVYPSARGYKAPFLGVPLHRAGYRTFALTGNGQVDSSFGFDGGFEVYQLNDWIHDPEKTLAWLDGELDGPFFLFLHTYEAHEPYTHSKFLEGVESGRLSGEFSKATYRKLGEKLTDVEKEYVRALYDSDIAYTDEKMGALFRGLERRGRLDDTIVIVTTDHGEQLWDHGTWGHGQSMHEHQIRVPLVLHLPERLGFPAARVEPDQVELLDLYPTVLDLLGLPPEPSSQGRSIRQLLEGKGPMSPKPALAENTNIRAFDKRALRTPRFKFVLWNKRKAKGEEPANYELYDLRADPGELVNLATRHPEQVQRLRTELERRIGREGGAADEELPANVDGELRKQLEALGYIGN